MRSIKETAVSFFRKGGHNHDGKNSTKIDFNAYTPDDLRILADLIQKSESELSSEGDAADVISGGTQVGSEFVNAVVDSPKALSLETDVTFDGHERTYIDASWEAPPVQDFYYDEYYFDYYSSAGVFGSNVVGYLVGLQKIGDPPSDHRTYTKNTNIRFWDVDPDCEYQVTVWAVNSLNQESLHITDVIESQKIKKLYVGQKNRNLNFNGFFEDDISGWTVRSGSGTLSWSTRSHEGTHALRISQASGTTEIESNLIPVTPEIFYDISMWVAGDNVGITGDGYAKMTVEWYDEFGTLISSDEGETMEIATDWLFYGMPDNNFIQAPTVAAHLKLIIEYDRTGMGTEFMDIDSIRVEEASIIEGIGWRTDNNDQAPRIEVVGHDRIHAPRYNNEGVYTGISFEEKQNHRAIFDQKDKRDAVLVQSGKPDKFDELAEETLESELRVISSSRLLDDAFTASWSDLEYYDGRKNYSLPRGVIGYKTKNTNESGINATERFIIGIDDMFIYPDRVYRFEFHCGNILTSTAGDIFELRFQMAGTTLQSFSFIAPTPTGLAASVPSVYGGTYRSSIERSGIFRVTMQRTSGTGSAAVNVGTNNMYITLMDIGSAHTDDFWRLES